MSKVNFIIAFSIICLVSCRSEKTLEDLKSEIGFEFEKEAGDFALAFKNLQSGEEILINENERFHAASTMKTPVMIEVFKQEAAGLFSQEDSVWVKNEFYSIVDSSVFQMDIGEDSEEKLYSLVGKKLPIGELVYDMIIWSSNLATNIIIDLVDAKKVTQTMREMGADSIHILRGVEDLKAFEKGLSNSTTALDLMIMFENLAKKEVVSSAASERMIEILLDQKFNEIIPARLPEGVKVAHKTGSITGVHHDSGIVYLPDGSRYVLVILSKNLGDFDEGTEQMAKVSGMIYDFVVRKQ